MIYEFEVSAKDKYHNKIELNSVEDYVVKIIDHEHITTGQTGVPQRLTATF
jgi:hypothetical protein